MIHVCLRPGEIFFAALNPAASPARGERFVAYLTIDNEIAVYCPAGAELSSHYLAAGRRSPRPRGQGPRGRNLGESLWLA